MLDEKLKEQFKAYMEHVTEPLVLLACLDDSEAARELRALLDEIAALSDKISWRVDEAADSTVRRPSFSIQRSTEAARIRFAAIPLGLEFSSLVLALLQVGGHPPKLEADVLQQVQGLQGDLHFETVMSLSCHNCPDLVQALNTMAVINPRISHVVIDGALFQDEVTQRQIMSVPTVLLNGKVFAQGRLGVQEIVSKLDQGSLRKDAAKLSARAPYEVLIVGGGPAGCAAALYAARKGIRTAVVAERMGGQLLDTMSIENYIAVPQTDGPQFAAAMEQQLTRYGVDIINAQQVQALVPRAKSADAMQLRLVSGGVLKARSVIIATGARWRELNVPGEKQYRNHGVAYCAHCDGPLFKGRRVAVIGGGNSGVEAAIDLAGVAQHVSVLEFSHALRADAVLLQRLQSLSNVEILTQVQTTEITGDGQRVTGLKYLSRPSAQSHHIALDGVFIQIGLVPNTEWLKGVLELSAHGEIVVDARGRTSVPGVFAAGDVTIVEFKQIGIAAGDGAKAALSAFDYLIRSAPVLSP